jgi:hypothetical protein
MDSTQNSYDIFIRSLEERAKELNCLYTIEELLSKTDLNLVNIIYGIIETIPRGLQYSFAAKAKITIYDETYQSSDFKETEWKLSSEIKVQDEVVGNISIYYIEQLPPSDEGPFHKEEKRLIKTVADRIGHFILHQNLKSVFNRLEKQKAELENQQRPEWKVVLDLLRNTDQNLFSIVSRKMLNHLFTRGIKESDDLFKKLGSKTEEYEVATESNRPSKKQVLQNTYNLADDIFNIASNYFSDEEVLSYIHKWMHEEKSLYLVKALANLSTPLTEIADAIRKYHHVNPQKEERTSPTRHGIRVALIRRFLTDQLDYIEIAKNYSGVKDFYKLLHNMIFPPESHGKLGGKSAGLFLANKIIEKSTEYSDILENVKTPKTWYITSDGLMNFIYYNNLEDVIEQKYKDIDDIRREYPHIIQAFKNSHFAPSIINGLSRALDDFGDSPLIVRSSSLLEDRMGSAFAGKYKSLFVANQGSKQQRLEEILDAISEVYASTFGPDPIGYRAEKGLLDFNEEMGIMIQEVVGTKIGQYFFPAFAGVAFSNNEFRWSPRIKREDGLIRLVTGLGTRAVDRVGNDFPALIAPGQPDLRLNLGFEERMGYAQKYMDVINLETNTFETISIDKLLKFAGNSFPLINDIFSIIEENHLKKPVGIGIDTKKHDVLVTFDNLLEKTNYVDQIFTIMQELKDKLMTPVDIEFACDGTNLYILQCRPQSSASDASSAVIPKDVAKENVVFTANKYVTNGKVPNIAYIVYVDPVQYSKKESLEDLKDIGKAVGLLNKKLPKKTFVLMGPGRWGSRDEIRLGVKVTYSDINNSAMLIEIAKTKGNYTPELSFGTHFFLDLVEANIRYLPLYPDDEDVAFNYDFLNSCENTLTRFLPEFENIADTLKVINLREAAKGKILRVLMNADQEMAMGLLADPSTHSTYSHEEIKKTTLEHDEPLQWRKRMAESIALKIDGQRFGIKGIYLFGTVFNETAGPNSDIDLLVHFAGSEKQLEDLKIWFDGWNLCLSQINYNRSGYSLDEFLDVTYIRDEDFKDQKYYVDIMDPNNQASKKLKMKSKFRG